MKTPAELDNLLVWLGQDQTSGARQYVEVRQKLVALFECRGCEASEDLADETLDRTALSIRKPGFTFEGNPIAYLRGVARNVYLESLRKNRTISQETLPEFADRVAQVPTDGCRKESLADCLDGCLGQLPDDRRAFLLSYYQGERSAKIDGRAKLAQKEGIELNALRIQIFRLKNTVRKCVESCARAREIEPRF